MVILWALALVCFLLGSALFLVGIRAEVRAKGAGIRPGMTGVILTIIGVVGLVTLGASTAIQALT